MGFFFGDLALHAVTVSLGFLFGLEGFGMAHPVLVPPVGKPLPVFVFHGDLLATVLRGAALGAGFLAVMIYRVYP